MKKYTLPSFLFFLAMIISISSCKKIMPQPPQVEGLELFGTSIKTNVSGRICDEHGMPIENAKVTAGFGSEETYTDINGVFTLKNIDAYKSHAYVKVTKAGYFNGSRSFIPSESATNLVEIQLLKKNFAGQFNAAIGGNVSLENVTILFPAGAIYKNNLPYIGSVNVYLNYMDPTDPKVVKQMPGNLTTVYENKVQLLQSFGMVTVELYDTEGTLLQIKEGEKAEIHFPIAQSQLDKAENEIQLWCFNESKGIWDNAGKAIKNGDEYVAQVAHFSTYNCDSPFGGSNGGNIINCRGFIKDNNGNNISGIKVDCYINGVICQSTISDIFGFYSILIPGNENFTIKISTNCGINGDITLTSVDFTSIFQSFEYNFEIQLGYTSKLITGSIYNCNGEKTTDGYIVINNTPHFAENGDFHVIIGACLTEFEYYTVDLNTSYFSDIFSQTIGDDFHIDLGNITTCNSNSDLPVSDLNGRIYKTVKIGNQIWMAENLQSETFSNGDPIYGPGYVTAANTPAFTYISELTVSHSTYGKYYNWYAVQDERNVCPTGWRVPTENDLTILLETLDPAGTFTDNVAGGKMKIAGTSESLTSNWHTPNTEATNISGFSSMANGLCGGSFYVYGKGYLATYFINKEVDSTTALMFTLQNSDGKLTKSESAKEDYTSIRCIKN